MSVSKFVRTKVITTSVVLTAALGLLVAPITPLIGNADSTSSYVSLNSFSGHPGVTLAVTGGGYAKGEIVTINAVENGSVIAATTATATTNGEFSTPLTLPTKLAQGTATITAAGKTSGLTATNGYFVAPFTPSLTTSAGSTTPYGVLTVGGNGYAPNEIVDLNLAGATATATADATGAFKGASLTTPAVPAASYTLIGAGEASGASTVAYEYVNGFYPYASPSSYYVLPLTSLGFTGSGFAPNETVNVTDAVSGAAISSFKATSDGSFANAGAFSVPASYAGTSKSFVLTGSLSHATTSVTTGIGQYYPNVSPTGYYVLPGKTVSFNGSGFIPGETVNVTVGKTVVSSAVADSFGNLTAAAPVTVPTNAGGTVINYTLTGATSGGQGTAGVQIGNYNAQASPSTYYALPGAVVTFSGNGFASGEVVAVFSGKANLGNFTTDASGAFMNAGQVTIAYNQAGGSANYTLSGVSSLATVNLTLGVGQLNTQLTPSTYYVLPFAPFTLAATGFAPGETVTLSDGTDSMATAVAGKDGTADFDAVSLAPNTLGSVSLTATGATSGASATTTVGLGSYYPSVTADNYYAQPGTTISLTGNGFAPGEDVDITAGDTTQTVTTDETGAYTASIVLPYGQTTAGLDIVSTGALSDASNTLTITLAPFNIQVSPSTYYATPGSPVTFSGSGFIPGETISTYRGKDAGTTVVADAKGNFTSSTFTLPFGVKATEYTIYGLTSGAVGTVDITLAQFYAGAQLSSYYGNGGSMVTVSGSGFAPNEAVALTSGTATLGNVTTDGFGAFSKAVAMPYAMPGQVPVTATGALSQTSATTSYTVAKVYNSVGLASYAVPAGKAVTFTGSGFLANEPVTVTNDRDGTTYSFKADAKGNLNDSGYVLPATYAEGNLTLTINGSYSYTSSAITMYVQSPNAQ